MKRLTLLVLPLGIALLPLTACKQKQEEQPPASTKTVEPGSEPGAPQPGTAGEPGAAPEGQQPGQAGAEFNQTRDRAVQQMQAKLDDLDSKITNLKEQMKASGGQMSEEAKTQANDAITKLEESRGNLQSTIDDAKKATADNWQQVDQRANDAMKNADAAYDAAVKQMTQGGSQPGPQ